MGDDHFSAVWAFIQVSMLWQRRARLLPMLLNISSGIGTSRTVSKPSSRSKFGQSFLIWEKKKRKETEKHGGLWKWKWCWGRKGRKERPTTFLYAQKSVELAKGNENETGMESIDLRLSLLLAVVWARLLFIFVTSIQGAQSILLLTPFADKINQVVHSYYFSH